MPPDKGILLNIYVAPLCASPDVTLRVVNWGYLVSQTNATHKLCLMWYTEYSEPGISKFHVVVVLSLISLVVVFGVALSVAYSLRCAAHWVKVFQTLGSSCFFPFVFSLALSS